MSNFSTILWRKQITLQWKNAWWCPLCSRPTNL